MPSSERDHAIARDVRAIREAVFGRDVRGAIADGIEQCYADVSNSRTIADGATESATNAANLANQKAMAADAAAQNLDRKVEDIVLVQESQPSSDTNKIWVKPESDEYKVPTWDEFQELSDRVDHQGGGTADFPPGGEIGQCLMNAGDGNVEWGTPTNVDIVVGDLARKSQVQASYTPRGSVSAPSISVSKTKESIYAATTGDGGASVISGTAAAYTLPQLTMRVEQENLIISFTPGTFTPNRPTSVTLPTFMETEVISDVSAKSTAPSFTGETDTITSR